MEASSLIFSQIPCFSSSCRDSKPCFSSSAAAVHGGRRSLRCGFRDNAHLQYYSSGFISCMEDGGNMTKEKKRPIKLKKKKHLKLLKNLSRDLSTFSQMGFGLNHDLELLDEVQGRSMAEAAETLLQQLQRLKSEKEMKRKEEKRLKSEAQIKKRRLSGDKSSDSSSSESSDDSEIEAIFDMKAINQAKSSKPITVNTDSTMENQTPSSSICRDDTETGSMAKVEVCMGGKCKRSGGTALMEEFEKVMGLNGAVCGCKCMGKCRDGPNVKVMNSLCIGVGLDDVNSIVSKFIGSENDHLLQLSPAV